MSLLRRHRAVRDVPEGDVITQTEPEIDAEPDTRSTKGKTDQPTGENPKPARESATKRKRAPRKAAAPRKTAAPRKAAAPAVATAPPPAEEKPAQPEQPAEDAQ